MASHSLMIPLHHVTRFTSPAVERIAAATLQIEDMAERLAGVRIMNRLASFHAEERWLEISALFADGYLEELEAASQSLTAENVDRLVTESQAEGIKERLLLQLVEHGLEPVSYQTEDKSTVVEFLCHPSRLVVVFDEEGIQILWSDNFGVHSEVVKNHRANFDKVSTKVAVILHTSDRR